jgi:hypothetical protein
MQAAGITAAVPAGWHFHVDGEGKQTIACGETCFDIVWMQRRWRRGERGRAMEELPVDEVKLIR